MGCHPISLLGNLLLHSVDRILSLAMHLPPSESTLIDDIWRIGESYRVGTSGFGHPFFSREGERLTICFSSSTLCHAPGR